MGRKLGKDQLKAIHAGVTGFNVKLKKSEVIQNPKEVTLRNGRKAVRGVGSDGTPIFRFIKS